MSMTFTFRVKYCRAMLKVRFAHVKYFMLKVRFVHVKYFMLNTIPVGFNAEGF